MASHASLVSVLPSSPAAVGDVSRSDAGGVGSGVGVDVDGGSPSHSRSYSRHNSFSQSESAFWRSSWSSNAHLTKEEKAAAAVKQAAAESALKQQQVGGSKTITFVGGVAFLINNITGGGMVLFPRVFQEAGWLVVICGLMAVACLVTACGFMIIEAMAMMPGNKRFQKRVEYTTLTNYYLPKKLYWISQLFFQLSLTCNSISMIIQSCQVMDFTLAELFGRSCAIPEFYPNLSVHCPDPISGHLTVFGNGLYLIPLGWYLTLSVVLPLGFVNLDDNIFVQKGGFLALLTIVGIWIGIFVEQGFETTRVPMIGKNFTQVIGVVVFNFAVITSIPSWVNEKKENVSIGKSFIVSMPLAVCIFLFLGLFGGLAFDRFEGDQTVLVAIFNLGTKLSKVTFFLFPACVNLTSIPVCSILQRYNLTSAGVCGPKVALFIGVILPWLISIPLYTGSGYELVVTWSGICITSVVNFVVPPILYLLAIREKKVAASRRASMRRASSIRHSGTRASISRPSESHREDGAVAPVVEPVPTSHAITTNAIPAPHTDDIPTPSPLPPPPPHAVVASPVEVPPPPPSDRKFKFVWRRRDRDRDKEKAADRARQAKEKRDARRRKKLEEFIPDESELQQSKLLPVLPFVTPRRWHHRLYWVAMMPVKALFYCTIPHPHSYATRVPPTGPPLDGDGSVSNHRSSRWKLFGWNVLTFVNSLVWLVGLTYLTIWFGTLVASGTTIHPILIGITLIGVGSRMPALWTEYRGYKSQTGDMNRVLLNNVLQMIIAIPIPWLLYHAFHGGASIQLYAGPLVVLFLMLFIMGALVVIVFRSYDWLASRPVKIPIITMAIFFGTAAWLFDYSLLLRLNDDRCIEPSE